MRRTPIWNITYSFVPKFEAVATLPPIATEQALRQEKSMYSATDAFVKKHGGPISRLLLAKIPQWYYDKARALKLYPNIDIRVHHFSADFLNTPGLELYPAIPGLHCDGEWRETYFSQPDLHKVPVSHHLIATVATEKGISNTQFLLDTVNFDAKDISDESTLWEKVDSSLRGNPNLRFTAMPDGELTLFDSRSLHEATPVKFPGGRLFFRCSMWHKPNLGEGQLSLNEQLYTVFHPPAMLPSHSLDTASLTTASQYHVIDKVQPVFSIDALAKEPSIMSADANFMQENGGPIANALLRKVPKTFFDEAEKRKLRTLFDFFVYRLYPSYLPNFPGYDQKPRLSGWHLPVTPVQISQSPTPEIQISLSSCDKSVNKTALLLSNQKTTFSKHTNHHYFWRNYNNAVEHQKDLDSTATVTDGDVVMTTSHTARRELPVMHRGWRAMFRASMQEGKYKQEIVKQQYVSIPYRGKGW